MIDQGDKAQSAFRFHQLGLVVLPVHYPVDGHCSCRAAWSCGSPTKHPACSWKAVREQSEGELDAVLREYPQHNLGASLAGSGLVVVDVDPGRGGDQALAEFAARRRNPLPATLRVRTASGGSHLYFRVDHRLKLDRDVYQFLHGVDVKGHGGMVLIPPSRNLAGRSYVLDASSPSEPVPLPVDVLGRLRLTRTARQRAKQAPHPPLSRASRLGQVCR